MWAALPKYPIKGMMRLAMVAGLGLFALSGLSSKSLAVCVSPAGVEGEITFNENYKTPQYCDNTNWIAMMGAEPYQINAIEFNGTNNLLSASLTGMTDSQKFIVSFWVKPPTETATFYNIFDVGGARFHFALDNGANDTNGLWTFYMDTNTPQVFEYESAEVIPENQWSHILISGDASTSTLQVYINSVVDTPIFSAVNSSNTVDFTRITSVLGSFEGGGNPFSGGIADFWFEADTYLDLSVAANRRKFIDGTGNPVYLGSDGNKPLGTAPDVFLSGDTATWHTNDGTGGGFTENGALTTATDYPGSGTQIVPSGLVGHWRLDETSGTTAADSSGNGNHGTMQGGLTGANSVAGLVGNALDFTSSVNHEIEVPTNAALQITGDVALSTWIYVNDPNTTVQPAVIQHAISGETEATNSLYSIHITDFSDAGVMDIRMTFEYGAGNNNNLSFDTNLLPKRWYHLVLVRDDTAKEVDLYVDGAFFGTQTYTNSATGGSSGVLIIGANAGTANDSMDGYADDVRLYNRTLTPEEITEIYNATDGIHYNETNRVPEFFDGNRMMAMPPPFPDVTTNLVGHWKLDEATGTTVADSSGNGYTGTWTGSASVNSVSGAVGAAYHFDGVDDRVSTVDTPDFEVQTDFSASVWFKLDQTSANDQRILFKEHSVEPYVAWELTLNNGNNEVMFLLSNTSSNSGVATSYFYVGTNPVSVGQWYHAVAVKEGSDLRIYLNGAEDQWYINGPYTGTPIDSDGDLEIGGNGSNLSFRGQIDDARVYDRALSVTEIQKLYNMGAPSGTVTALPQGCPNIGDVCDDGTIYAGLAPEDGTTAMYAASFDSPTELPWNNNNTSGYVLTNITDNNTGEANTNALVVLDSDSGVAGFQPHQAAQYCYDLVSNGADDWYLPTWNEINVVLNNHIAFGITPDRNYWLSDEISSSNAARKFYESATQSIGTGNNPKSADYYARCYRKGPAPRCANPYGVEGSMLYNDDNNVVQYCDGARWLAIGKDQ